MKNIEIQTQFVWLVKNAVGVCYFVSRLQQKTLLPAKKQFAVHNEHKIQWLSVTLPMLTPVIGWLLCLVLLLYIYIFSVVERLGNCVCSIYNAFSSFLPTTTSPSPCSIWGAGVGDVRGRGTVQRFNLVFKDAAEGRKSR